MGRLEKLLKETNGIKEHFKEKSSLLKDEVVATTLFYPNPDLIHMHPFRVVQDGKLVNEE